MKVNWDEGFRRIRYAFLVVSWAIFFALQPAYSNTAYEIAEYSVYMLVFTVCTVLVARGCIWIVRGFLGGARQISGGSSGLPR